jgi:predicted RNase H-like nuclease (RuvC/YqgF family)
MKNSYKIAEVINVVDNKASVDNAVEKYSELKLELSQLEDEIEICDEKFKKLTSEREDLDELMDKLKSQKRSLYSRVEQAGNFVLTEINKNVEKQKELEKTA